jgi:hypothetical protein
VSSFWQKIWSALPVAAVMVGYLPVFLALPAIAPEVVRKLLGGERLFLLAAYTAVSYVAPVLFLAVRLRERGCGLPTPRLRRACFVASAANWLPHCATVLAWVVLSDPSAWIP